uniref:Dynamin-like GTPase OPA1 C-terminal domain-containing protein n=1 Tax=Biomphalaria glabrata TaxID=6526 RepID=A0A2C9LP81_BIOGL
MSMMICWFLSRYRAFNTAVDIKLRQWADVQLPKKCVEIGWDTLHEQFTNLLEQSKKSKDYDQVFDMLKSAVVQMTKTKHDWESKAEDSLVNLFVSNTGFISKIFFPGCLSLGQVFFNVDCFEIIYLNVNINVSEVNKVRETIFRDLGC